MANPPIVIGSFDNVPAPGSPIKSDWPQEISTYVQALPRGRLGSLARSADQTGIAATPTDVGSLTFTWTAVANRQYWTYAEFHYQQLTAGGNASIVIADGAGVQIQGHTLSLALGEYGTLVASMIETGLSGSITRKVRALTSAGTITILSAASAHALLIVQDLGAPLPS